MPQTPCDIAQERYSGILMWRNLWTLLLFIFGTAVVLVLVASIVLFIRASWLPAALTTLSTIVGGAGIAWVSKQRQTAVTEEKEAFNEVVTQCGGPSPKLNPAQAVAWANQQPWMRALQASAWSSVSAAFSSKMATQLLRDLRGPF
jgi:hypothetical protein